MSIKTGLRVSAIFILLIVFASGSTAQEVTQNDAKRAAEIWNGRLDSYDSYVLNRAVPFSVSDDPIVGHYIIRGDNDRILAYVYNLEPRGFVAVSADQGLKPIIAYSRNSDFDPEPNPQNILLQLIKSDISERLRILERNINRDELRRTASEEWEELYSGRLEKATAAQATYGPHMSTTWTQSTQNGNDVFNIYTPSNWVSGCVATAGGQILKYWDWPTRGVGSYAYTPSAVGSEISADFGSTTYAWSDMLDSYAGASTLTQRQATGLMVYHVGVSVDMEYTDSSSGTQTPRTARALKDYFRYTGEYVQGSDADFYTRLQENMENGKPAELSIRTHPDSTYSGHAIVVDGFRDADSFYHLNFGWAGSYDAWYDINPMNLPTGSIRWEILNGAVLDIVPDPYFSTEVDTNTTGGYTLSWSVSSNLSADKYELVEASKAGSTSNISDDAEGGTGDWTAEGYWESSTAYANGGSKSFRAYVDSTRIYYNHTLELVNAIYVGSSTAISYYWKTASYFNSRAKIEVSTDGVTWDSLRIHSTTTQDWTLENSLDLSSYVGYMVSVRFSSTYAGGGYVNGTASTNTGFFVDDFTISDCYAVDWATVDNNIATNSYSIAGKTVDETKYYYKVRAYRDSQWWDWSNIRTKHVGMGFLNLVLSTLADTTVMASNQVDYQLSSTYNGSGTLTYSVSSSSLPGGASYSLNSSTGEFSWTTGISISGSYYIIFSVTDGVVSDTERVDVTVTAYGSTVSLDLNSIADQSVTEGDTLSFQLSSTYNYSGTVVYSVSSSSLPAGASYSLDSSTGAFSWSTDFETAGSYTITFSATDGGVTDTETVNITVGAYDFVSNGTFNTDTTSVSGTSGGTVTISSGGFFTQHKVVIPAGALNSDKTVIIKPVTSSDIPETQVQNVPSAVNFVVEGSESSFTFEDSVTITIEFKNQEVANSKSKMRVHMWDSSRNRWKRVRGACTIDSTNNTLTVKVTHFSIYGAIELSETSETFTISSGWNMICMPMIPGSITDPDSLFGDDINPYYNETNNSSIYQYNEASGLWAVPDAITDGRGYILYAFSNTNIDASGLEETSDITQTLSVTDNNGWNLIGNPYAVDLDMDTDMTFSAGVAATCYIWNGSEYVFYPGAGHSSTLAPWEGVFVRASINNATIDFQYPVVAKRAGAKQPEIDWRVQITAQNGDKRDTHNYLGIGPNALTGYDSDDKYELVPLDESFVSVYFPHDDWDEYAANYTQDIKPSTLDDQKWTFIAASKDGEEEIMLRWTVPEALDQTYSIILTDQETGREINMRDISEYSFSTGPVLAKDVISDLLKVSNPVHRLRKSATSDMKFREFEVALSKIVEEKPEIPDRYFLDQNYPNPFNPETMIRYGLPSSGNVTLKIYNILGQEVRTVMDRHQNAGVHLIKWDGRNNYGQRVSSGVYIYRLITSEFVTVKKMIMIR